jgi:broad specificity phosphatase PhoE
MVFPLPRGSPWRNSERAARPRVLTHGGTEAEVSIECMRVVLIRHGKPGAVDAAPIRGHDIGRWVRQYDDAGITNELPPPAVACELVSSAGCVLVSHLPRARQSAAWLAASKEVRVDPELREAALPVSLASSIRLSPEVWVVVARVAWWFNWRTSDETIAMARQRASRMADRLAALALEHGSVVAVGHGMFNQLVASELRRRGWRGPRVLPRGYWSVAQFEHVGGRRRDFADAARSGPHSEPVA